MYNPSLKWNKSPSAPNVASYQLTWSLNGSPAGTQSLPASSDGDTYGYATNWSVANPTATLNGGDVVGASLTSVDLNNLVSSPVTPVPVSIPLIPPQPPENVVLGLR